MALQELEDDDPLKQFFAESCSDVTSDFPPAKNHKVVHASKPSTAFSYRRFQNRVQKGDFPFLLRFFDNFQSIHRSFTRRNVFREWIRSLSVSRFGRFRNNWHGCGSGGYFDWNWNRFGPWSSRNVAVLPKQSSPQNKQADSSRIFLIIHKVQYNMWNNSRYPPNCHLPLFHNFL